MLMVIYNIASLVLDEMIFFKLLMLAQRIMEETMALPAGILSEISEKVFSVSNFAALFILLPEVLCFLGMVMYTMSASRITEPSKDTGGLTLIQAAVFIELFFYLTIGFVIMGIFAVSMIREWEMGVLNPESLTVYLVLLGAALVVILMVLFYEIGVIRTIRSLKCTIRTGNPNDDISGYVIFMNFVISFCGSCFFISDDSVYRGGGFYRICCGNACHHFAHKRADLVIEKRCGRSLAESKRMVCCRFCASVRKPTIFIRKERAEKMERLARFSDFRCIGYCGKEENQCGMKGSSLF